jgi:NAD(P)-dependent dehydrogenase (short-subunit alcohol dehydrogenase family)
MRSMKGKVCIITGASSGLGLVTARALARMGARVALVCRDKSRGEAAVAHVKDQSGNPDVDLFLADLSIQAQIRRLAEELLGRYPEIHILINNAGLLNMSYSTTGDGIETVFAVNHLAYFLLTQLLLPRLKESQPARIVSVASDAHVWGRALNWDDLGHRRKYRAMRAYGQSKLANIMFTYELSRKLVGTGVTANCLHPGAVATRFGKNNGVLARGITSLMRPFFRSPERGAETSIYLASSPEVEGKSGKYFFNRKEKRSLRYSYDEGEAKRLWDLSLQMTGPVTATDLAMPSAG